MVEYIQGVIFHLMKNLFHSLLFGILLAVSSVSFAAGKSIPQLFDYAIKFGGFTEVCKDKEKCQLPTIVIEKEYVPGALGAFTIKQPTLIRISITHPTLPGTPDWESTIVHEMVHYLQFWTGQWKVNTSCIDMINKVEQPAYEAQAQFLKQIYKKKYDYSFTLYIASIACMSE